MCKCYYSLQKLIRLRNSFFVLQTVWRSGKGYTQNIYEDVFPKKNFEIWAITFCPNTSTCQCVYIIHQKHFNTDKTRYLQCRSKCCRLEKKIHQWSHYLTFEIKWICLRWSLEEVLWFRLYWHFHIDLSNTFCWYIPQTLQRSFLFWLYHYYQ